MKHSKRYKGNRENVDRAKPYSLQDAISIIKEQSRCKFDETVEVAARLGVNPKHADQMVRGTVALPHGTGRQVRVLVFAQGEKEEEAKAAGADFIGAQDLVEKIQGGWLDFDVAVATPDMMKVVGRLGKILGARGLMPNPKSGTVTMDLERTVKELKAGRIEYRVDRQANVAVPIGKVSFSEDNLIENFRTFVDALLKAKPATAKGAYMKGLSICSTMGIGIKLDHQAILADLKK
ncbi:MAG: 50S ribosomal protein L1 [Candidatus Zixiibacteriota bacterium]|nr:MAG: 50S ribosomal protein L1 [candidate division Zixibacteria bacterium]HDL04323.1 50S ribosomal protein L1 [candidate division Zixibacteria bacterium]